MEYLTLSKEERDDLVVAFYKGQEMEHFVHASTAERYGSLVEDEEIGEEAKEEIKAAHKAELEEMMKIEKVMQHTERALEGVDIEASLKRLKAKEDLYFSSKMTQNG